MDMIDHFAELVEAEWNKPVDKKTPETVREARRAFAVYVLRALMNRDAAITAAVLDEIKVERSRRAGG